MTNTKRQKSLSRNLITEDFVKQAINKSSIRKIHRKEVKMVLENIDIYAGYILAKIRDGTYINLISYKEKDKIGVDKKLRKLKMPSFDTLILQHICTNLLNLYYKSKDNYNGLNCKEDCGITADNRRKSVLKRCKHIFFDKSRANYILIMDQRKCYDHVRPSIFRKFCKKLIGDNSTVDFIVDCCFYENKLPIGAPSSSLIHHIIMMEFDYWIKTLRGYVDSVRYADDNLIAFETKEFANEAKWRIRNYWWYELKIRDKSNTTRIYPIDRKKIYFTGFKYTKNIGKGVCDKNKGYVVVSDTTKRSIIDCKKNKSYASYFGIAIHVDNFKLLTNIENRNMKLSELTNKHKMFRNEMDAKSIDKKDLLALDSFVIKDFQIRFNEKKGNEKEPNWVKLLIGVPVKFEEISILKRNGVFDKLCKSYNVQETELIEMIKKNLIFWPYSFSGSYGSLAKYLYSIEKEIGKDKMLPITDCRVEENGGLIFTDSIKYQDIFKLEEFDII